MEAIDEREGLGFWGFWRDLMKDTCRFVNSSGVELVILDGAGDAGRTFSRLLDSQSQVRITQSRLLLIHVSTSDCFLSFFPFKITIS